MTLPEGEALAAKLTRIWASGQVVDWFRGLDNSDSASFAFRAMLTEEVCFTCRDSRSSPGLLFRLSPEPQEATRCWASHIRCDSNNGEVKVIWVVKVDFRPSEFEQFVADWMNVFRRNCWLSGCDIECSAHEQLEWMQWYKEQECLV